MHNYTETIHQQNFNNSIYNFPLKNYTPLDNHPDNRSNNNSIHTNLHE